MATVNKDFRVKAGLVVEGSTATVNGKNIITAGVVDAKGDLIVGSANDAVALLAVGTDNYILTADSSATNGVAWKAPQAVGEFGSSIVFEGSTANDYETTLAVTEPTLDRTITFPDASGTVALTGDITSAIDALDTDDIEEGSTNQYFTSQRALTATALAYDVAGSAATAQSNAEDYADGLASNYEVSGAVSTHAGLTSTHGVTGDIVGTSDSQTLTNKTLTSPVVTGLTLDDSSVVFEGSSADANETTLTVTNPTEDRTITLPDATGTVALTNNKLSAFAATTSAELANVISDETGTGALVFANTPTLVTPNIGEATGTSLVLSGDLTVNGTTTTINSTEITVDDKNLTLGSVATPTDAGADGGGLTLKGTTDKTFSWVDATDSWTSSEHLNLASGKNYYLNGGLLKDATETFTNKTISGANNTISNVSLTTGVTGTLPVANGGTGITSLGTGIADFLGTPSSANLAATVTDETGTGVLVFSNTPTLVTPVLGAATATSIGFADTLTGSATAVAGTSETTIDTFAPATYSAAKYIVQMKNTNGDIEVIEILVAVDQSLNVYLTEYANVQSNGELGTTNADLNGGNVRLTVTAVEANTTVKVSKTYIKA
jgi:small nuclear ribonucleoprotein (snRNP)-like protein